MTGNLPHFPGMNPSPHSQAPRVMAGSGHHGDRQDPGQGLTHGRGAETLSEGFTSSPALAQTSPAQPPLTGHLSALPLPAGRAGHTFPFGKALSDPGSAQVNPTVDHTSLMERRA